MKKGFTLIEILISICIIFVLSLAGFLTINKLGEKQKEKNYNRIINEFESAAEVWLSKHNDERKNIYNIKGGKINQIKVTLNTLFNENLIENNVINPKTNQPFDYNDNYVLLYFNPESGKKYGLISEFNGNISFEVIILNSPLVIDTNSTTTNIVSKIKSNSNYTSDDNTSLKNISYDIPSNSYIETYKKSLKNFYVSVTYSYNYRGKEDYITKKYLVKWNPIFYPPTISNASENNGTITYNVSYVPADFYGVTYICNFLNTKTGEKSTSYVNSYTCTQSNVNSSTTYLLWVDAIFNGKTLSSNQTTISTPSFTTPQIYNVLSSHNYVSYKVSTDTKYNNITYKCYYKSSTETYSNNMYNGVCKYIGLPYGTKYTVWVRATDGLKTKRSNEMEIYTWHGVENKTFSTGEIISYGDKNWTIIGDQGDYIKLALNDTISKGNYNNSYSNLTTWGKDNSILNIDMSYGGMEKQGDYYITSDSGSSTNLTNVPYWISSGKIYNPYSSNSCSTVSNPYYHGETIQSGGSSLTDCANALTSYVNSGVSCSSNHKSNISLSNSSSSYSISTDTYSSSVVSGYSYYFGYFMPNWTGDSKSATSTNTPVIRAVYHMSAGIVDIANIDCTQVYYIYPCGGNLFTLNSVNSSGYAFNGGYIPIAYGYAYCGAGWQASIFPPGQSTLTCNTNNASRISIRYYYLSNADNCVNLNSYSVSNITNTYDINYRPYIYVKKRK